MIKKWIQLFIQKGLGLYMAYLGLVGLVGLVGLEHSLSEICLDKNNSAHAIAQN